MNITRYTIRAIPVQGTSGRVSGFYYEIGEAQEVGVPGVIGYYDDRQDARDAVGRLVEADRAIGFVNSYTTEHQG